MVASNEGWKPWEGLGCGPLACSVKLFKLQKEVCVKVEWAVMLSIPSGQRRCLLEEEEGHWGGLWEFGYSRRWQWRLPSSEVHRNTRHIPMMAAAWEGSTHQTTPQCTNIGRVDIREDFIRAKVQITRTQHPERKFRHSNKIAQMLIKVPTACHLNPGKNGLANDEMTTTHQEIKMSTLSGS